MHTARLFVAAACALALSGGASAQTFDSGSDGSDGALSFQPNSGVIVFDPVALGLDASDNVFNFTTIDVPTGTAVVLSAEVLGEGKPVYWLASGNVTITGVVDLDGEDGHAYFEPKLPSFAGAGGFNGGRAAGQPGEQGTPGHGPGGGLAFPSQFPSSGGGADGGSAGHAVAGFNSPTTGAGGGAAYGNLYLQPILGGSGGGGGTGLQTEEDTSASGGGAGGGAIVIACSGTLRIDGEVTANGGAAGSIGPFAAFARGGAGSGGAIRLMAARIEGVGSVSATGGPAEAFTSDGRIRIETFRYAGPSTVDPAPQISTPGSVFPPPTTPSLRLTQIDGVSVAATPTGAFEVPDVAITATAAVTLNLEATNVPLGTTLALVIRAEDGSQITATSTPLTGTLQSSTATAQVTFPSGFSRVFVTASWAP